MNGVKTGFFMVLLTMLFVVVGAIVDANFGGGGAFLWIFFFISIGINFFTYWFADTIVLKMHKAKEVTPEEAPKLHAMVDRLCERAKLPKPKVCVIREQVPNAFATGRNRNHSAVAVTTGLMNTLADDELEGVLAHELAHIRHYDMLLSTIVAAVVGAISIIGYQSRWLLIFGGGRRDSGNPLAGILGILLLILAPIGAMIIRSMISKSREYAADAGGAEICGNPAALASALRSIERSAAGFMRHHQPQEAMGTEATAHLYFINHFSLGQAANLFSTHPPTEERIRRLLALADRIDR